MSFLRFKYMMMFGKSQMQTITIDHFPLNGTDNNYKRECN